MNSHVIPITVISLPHETQRRARIKNQLDRLGLSFSFFDAINGQDLPADMPLPYNEARRLRIFGRGLTQGEIGCLLSHKAVLEVIARSTTPCTLVLEDDVVIDAGLPGILQDIQTHANTFDLVRFLSGPKISRIKKRKILTLNTAGLYRLLPLSCGAYAYVITPHGAQKLLAALPHSAFPIDMLMARTWETGLNALILHPGPVAHDHHFGSSIEGARYENAHIKPFRQRLYRAGFKCAEAILKYAAYYRLV